MCLPWHFLLLPSAELLPSAQIAAGADLVQPVTCCLWEENLTGAAARGSAFSWCSTSAEGGGGGGFFHSVLVELGLICRFPYGAKPTGSRFGPLLAIC